MQTIPLYHTTGISGFKITRIRTVANSGKTKTLEGQEDCQRGAQGCRVERDAPCYRVRPLGLRLPSNEYIFGGYASFAPPRSPCPNRVGEAMLVSRTQKR